MGFNLISIIEEFARLKQIDRESVAELIKEGLESTLTKKLLPESELIINIDFKNNTVTAKFIATVVEEVKHMYSEIDLENARKVDPEIGIGEKIQIEMPISNFGRKTIQSARQSIINRIKESETKKMKVDYEKQKGQNILGMVKKVEYNGYIVDIGFTEALLPTEEQEENEFYKVGDNIRAYIADIRVQKEGLRVILSRRRPEFIIRLFESEIPEILEGDVVIDKIVREPGYRTKVAVHSTNKNVDAFGSCIGPKGSRIEEIKKELHNEQVDIIEFSDNIETFIKNSIGPELIEKIILAERGRYARIIVNKKSKNIAIGKGGKNIKLAAKLTKYKLDVLLPEEYEVISAEERRITSQIYDLEGVTEKIGKILHNAGYTAVQDIHTATIEELCRIEGIGRKTAAKIKESAKKF